MGSLMFAEFNHSLCVCVCCMYLQHDGGISETATQAVATTSQGLYKNSRFVVLCTNCYYAMKEFRGSHRQVLVLKRRLFE